MKIWHKNIDDLDEILARIRRERRRRRLRWLRLKLRRRR